MEGTSRLWGVCEGEVRPLAAYSGLSLYLPPVDTILTYGGVELGFRGEEAGELADRTHPMVIL